MKPMPTDRNFLVKEVVMHYIDGRWQPNGTRWVEAHIIDGKVEPWCGNPRTRTIPGFSEILNWAELPNVY